MILFRLFLVLFFTICYCLGGQGHKWIRRYFGSIVFGLGILLLAYLDHHLGVLSILGAAWYCPSLIIFKYGVNDGSEFKKVLLRAIYGGSLGLVGLLISISGSHIILGILQFVSAIITTVYFGVANPFSKYPKLGNWATILEDAVIIYGAIGMVPFLI